MSDKHTDAQSNMHDVFCEAFSLADQGAIDYESKEWEGFHAAWDYLAGRASQVSAAAPAGLTDEQIMRIAGDLKQRNAGVWPGEVAFVRAIERASEGQAQTSAEPIGYVNLETLDFAVGFYQNKIPEGYWAVKLCGAAQLADSTAPGAPELSDNYAAAKPTCPYCNTTDIEFLRTCHNSDCKKYGFPEVTYEGWRKETAQRADSTVQGVHSDDLAVQAFADAMKAKMAKSRAKGRGGWEECRVEDLRRMMADHFAKGDPVDVGNFAMMLWNRGESTAAPTAQQSLTAGGAVPELPECHAFGPLAGLYSADQMHAMYRAGAASKVAGVDPSWKLGEWLEVQTLDEMHAFYMARLPAIREAAKEHGYAIGLHGTARRDFDLMAMQWRSDASDKDTLAHAIAMAACGITRDSAYQWEAKPNGRFAVSLPICVTNCVNPDFDKPSIGHIDLSLIEIAAAPLPQVQPSEALEVERVVRRLMAAGVTTLKLTVGDHPAPTAEQIAASINSVLDALEATDQQPVTPSGALGDSNGGVA